SALFRQPPASTLFPYSTLFRSGHGTYGKHLLTRLEDGRTLHTHLRMEGRWRLIRTADISSGRNRADRSPYVRAILGTDRWTALGDRKSTRLNSSHVKISYAVFC